MKQIRKALASVKKADNLYNLISDGDKIAIGISGGKDSIVLFHALVLYQKFAKKDFEIIPIMLNLGFPGFNPSEYEAYFAEKGCKLHIVDSSDIYKVLQIQQDRQQLSHLPCSICSRMRKAAINQTAKKEGANKVAYAHHIDDALETLFMNMIGGSRLATFAPKMFLENVEITFIRPFILLDESTISRVQKEENLPLLENPCPNEKKTRREDIKTLLHDIYIKYPEARTNFKRMLENDNGFDLWFDKIEIPLLKNIYIKPVKTNETTKEFIDLLNKNNTKQPLDLQNAFLLVKNEKPVATLSYSNVGPNSYLVSSFVSKEKVSQKHLSLFINEIENKLYRENRPLYLSAIISKEYEKLFNKLGYIKNSEDKTLIMLKKVIK